MNASRPGYLPRLQAFGALALLVLSAWAASAGGALAQSLQQGAQSQPPPPYFLTFAGYYDGDYVATAQALTLFGQNAIKNPAAGGLWIDSICYQTMLGECAYQMGNHVQARVHYESALLLLIRFNTWMLSVQFPPVITPATPQQLVVVPWYVTMRKTVVGHYPPTINIMQGNINNINAVINGGIVQPPVLMPINVQEIVRCSCLAIRRWREIMGPYCPHSPTTQALVQVLAQRPAIPNHWSETWVEVQLALAYAAAGKDDQARKHYEKAELVAFAFDHPFTCTVHLELGRLDLAAGNFQGAQTHFLEASWSAAQFSDYGVLEEALRYGALAHSMSNPKVPYLPLAGALGWAAAQGLTQLNASLLLSTAENQLLMDQPALAMASLTAATALTLRTNLPAGKLGARTNHLKAAACYDLGQVDGGNVALAAAMGFQTLGSLWLYQIGVIDVLWVSELINDRVAMELYGKLLREPTPTDWMTDPLESLSVLTVPHPFSFEHWFEAALVRKNKEHEKAMEIADLTRRHRFLSSTEIGGRLLNLRWLMEAPEAALDDSARLQRHSILARFPAYEQRSREAKRLRGELLKLPLVLDLKNEDEKEAARQQAELLTNLYKITGEQELILRQVAMRREPANLIFPPVRSFKDAQASLADGQGLLVYFTTSRYTYAFYLEKDKYDYWEFKANKRFPQNITSMMQKWGNFEQNKEMKLVDLSDAWRKPAQEVMNVLMPHAGTRTKNAPTKLLDELVIVPDGMLWYIPFEALPVAVGNNQSEPLIHRTRVRYAPTVGLAIGDQRRRRTRGNMGVVLGRLFPRDEPAVADAAFEDISRAIPNSIALRDKPPAPGALFASLFDRLIVLAEIVPPGPGYGWSPLQVDGKAPGGALAQWMALPFYGPEQVILPAFRTPAERSLKAGKGDVSGADLFMSICGLMGSGARTVLISRWRTGGQTSIDLVREFAQELPHTTASDAWQRSVQLVSKSEVNVGAEPRLNLKPQQQAPKAEHPFFWAGYLLADTGALPMTDEEEEAAEKVLIVEAAKPAEPNANAIPAAGGNGRGNGQNAGQAPPAANAPLAGPKEKVVAAPALPGKPTADEPVMADGTDDAGGKPRAKVKPTRPPRADRKKPVGKTKKANAAA